jgi:hypothetical protein
MSAKILENDLHVFVVSWRTQEIIAYRDLKTGEITQGSEDKIEQVGYVAVLTRLEDELDNKVTGGWKVIDVSAPRSPHFVTRILTRARVADGEEGRLSSIVSSIARRPPYLYKNNPTTLIQNASMKAGYVIPSILTSPTREYERIGGDADELNVECDQSEMRQCTHPTTSIGPCVYCRARRYRSILPTCAHH